jgi:NodT family efflux transporter outer membrane factor (OMF) lipoprotein
MRAPTTLLIVPLVLALAGCALQSSPAPAEIQAQSIPNLRQPTRWSTPGAVDGPVQEAWLAAFRDPQLDALVREALVYNTDLQVAAARIEEAAGYAKLAGSTLYPAVNLLARGGGKLGGDNSGLSGVGLFANWELDLWGRARSASAAGTAQYQSVVADAEYARQSIAAAVAKSWYLAIEARLQRALADEIVRSSEQTLGLTRDRLRVGIGDEYDVAQALASLDSYRDVARQLALAEQQAQRALETLVGRYPAAAIDVAPSLPATPPDVPVGLPSELLERRPDVIAAERRVAAAFNRVAESRAARLPKLALTAGVTSVSSELFVLKQQDNPVTSLGANLTAPIFSGWALEAQVDIRTAEQKRAIAEYGRVAQRAFSEVESALSAAFAADEREVILQSAVSINARALELAQTRLRVGSGDLRGVLQQNVALSSARTTLLRIQAERLVQRVNLSLALGGPFEPPPAAAQSSGQSSAVASSATEAAR